MRVLRSSATALSLALLTSSAASAADCSIFQSEFDDINADYDEKYKSIEAEANSIADDAEDLPDDPVRTSVGVDVEIKWNNKKLAFDTPSVTMKDRSLSFGVPQVSMNIRRIVFDTVKTTMVNKKVGQYPEFKCSGLKCKTTWSNIYTKVPEVKRERTEIKTKIPEFVWDETSVTLKIPEFFMERQEIVLKLPEFTVRDIHVEQERIEDRSDQLSSRANATKEGHVERLGDKTSELYGCLRSDLSEEKIVAEEEFDRGLTDIDAAIAQMRANNIDPASVQTAEGDTLNLLVTKQEILNKKAEATRAFDEALEDLLDSEAQVLADLAK